MPVMKAEDRNYFMLRGREERAAARRAPGATVRNRHEELAWLYEMRVIYIDRGLVGDDAEESPSVVPIQHIVVGA